MKTIQILGTGCPKCKKLAENAEAAAKTLGIEYELVKVTNINEIARMGAMMTPGLAIDGELKSSGKVLSLEEIKALLY
ncbi:MAG: TM0996/MTH895 family glutaredoxin-like protein [Candidatus Eisenbacteria bacterium]|uniref:TM0996/MTH895 family glutaredoxin-like protein n=1 Tax=Eiseniibacteriota bacterium TaxID=2212470 RepID=A0A948W519_UNCEI|nr:TM0996/MTH895 family glutaredoxin-like protein [Candidatus Eisenbacteria bacterium]MBU1949419.1 TM0996/MTH895 family glutaredoxin-like protein [Candidatus Eisenbacteria bacterium]MBU2689575.1 TM0996/MTH895 family glutaredoxin-like protein [Candidatus Eisenbacteria bacterium]